MIGRLAKLLGAVLFSAAFWTAVAAIATRLGLSLTEFLGGLALTVCVVGIVLRLPDVPEWLN
jgi:hypothetical protein